MTDNKKTNEQLLDIIEINRILTRNMNTSLKDLGRDVNSILEKIKSLNCWSNAVQQEKSFGLILEIFIDLQVSIQFSISALYKYADMALRSALENSLNLSYFIYHPIEFEWWKQGEEWYIESRTQHPWGQSYNYFKQFEKGLTKSARSNLKRKNDLVNHIDFLYKELSKSIHSTSPRSQTMGKKLVPSVGRERFKAWFKRIQRTVSLINSLFVLVCNDKFHNMSKSDKNLVVSVILREHEKILRTMELL